MSTLIYLREPGECANCGRETNLIGFLVQEYVCSERCYEVKWEELLAQYEAEGPTEILRADKIQSGTKS